MRRVVPVLALLAAVPVGLALGSGCGGSDKEEATTLIVSRAENPRGSGDELVVSVQGRAAKNPSAATADTEVGLMCLDASGKTTLVARHRWPFLDEPGFPYPHVHQPASPQQIEATVRCRLTGTRFPIEGELRGGGA